MIRILSKKIIQRAGALTLFITKNFINKKRKLSFIDLIILFHNSVRNSYIYKIITFIYMLLFLLGVLVSFLTIYIHGFDKALSTNVLMKNIFALFSIFTYFKTGGGEGEIPEPFLHSTFPAVFELINDNNNLEDTPWYKKWIYIIPLFLLGFLLGG